MFSVAGGWRQQNGWLSAGDFAAASVPIMPLAPPLFLGDEVVARSECLVELQPAQVGARSVVALPGA
ncbi:MAG: hypothetical protein R3D69_16955 [Xanthobacteraceae bacterium]